MPFRGEEWKMQTPSGVVLQISQVAYQGCLILGHNLREGLMSATTATSEHIKINLFFDGYTIYCIPNCK